MQDIWKLVLELLLPPNEDLFKKVGFKIWFLLLDFGIESEQICLISVRREWLVHEDGAFALQLQDQESRLMFTDPNKDWFITRFLKWYFTVAAHYGHNRERNRIVRQDTPQARKEQEDELKQALLLQNIQQQLRHQQSVFFTSYY